MEKNCTIANRLSCRSLDSITLFSEAIHILVCKFFIGGVKIEKELFAIVEKVDVLNFGPGEVVSFRDKTLDIILSGIRPPVELPKTK